MTQRYVLQVFLAFLAGLPACKCGDDPTDDTDSADTGTSLDSDSDPDSTVDTDTAPPCTTVVTETTPEEGGANWYWRDAPEVVFNQDALGSQVEILDAKGAPVAITARWAAGNVRVSLEPLDPLAPSSNYQIHVNVCDTDTHVNFTTNAYGEPMGVTASDLVGRTYVISFSTVEFTEPAGVGALLGTLITNPELVGVTAADAKAISFVATEGVALPTGGYDQVAGSGVWSFPPGDFTSQPYFATDAEAIVLTYDAYELPIEGFHLEGTFASDGSSFGGGRLSGLADTRELCGYFGSSDPGYVCNDLLGTWGIPCEDCSDGGHYCMFIAAQRIEAPLVPGFTITAP
jgi:hypothetical protein